MQKDNGHPADLFVDRYMVGASDEQRAEARENVVQFVAILVRIDARIKRERRSSDSSETDSCGRFEADSTSNI